MCAESAIVFVARIPTVWSQAEHFIAIRDRSTTTPFADVGRRHLGYQVRSPATYHEEEAPVLPLSINLTTYLLLPISGTSPARHQAEETALPRGQTTMP